MKLKLEKIRYADPGITAELAQVLLDNVDYGICANTFGIDYDGTQKKYQMIVNIEIHEIGA